MVCHVTLKLVLQGMEICVEILVERIPKVRYSGINIGYPDSQLVVLGSSHIPQFFLFNAPS